MIEATKSAVRRPLSCDDSDKAGVRMRNRLPQNLLASAIAVLVSGTTAFAQQPAQEQVTVTGSRIQRETGFTTPVPVTAVTIEELNTFQPGTTIADQLDQLPQFFQTESAQRGGGALFGSAGRSSLNMRAMGAQRTLVLLDGARIVPADRDGAVHVDNIPTALLSQVEVVTGGASAAYGADALAGVTNFRLNRNYTGLDLTVGTGVTDFGDGEQFKASLAYGVELADRVHFIGSIDHHTIDEIVRDPGVDDMGEWFQRWGVVEDPVWTAGDHSGPRRLVLPNVHSTLHTPTGRINSGRNAAGQTIPFSLAGLNFSMDGQSLRPFVAGDVVGVGTGDQSGGPEAVIANLAFNGGPNGAQVINDNYFAGITYDIDDSTRFWSNLLVGNTESNQRNRRGIPHLTNPWYGQIFVTNPYLPVSVRQAMIDEGVDSFRIERQGNVVGVPGQWGDHETALNRYKSWTLQVGLDHDLGDNWSMQFRAQSGQSDRYTTVLNEIRVDREFMAMDAVEVYTDLRDLTDDAGTGGPDGLPDLVPLAQTGAAGTTIICNVQRYNPTPLEFQAAVVGVKVPAPQGDATLGGPADLVPIPGPIGPDVVDNCKPLNVLGQGNASASAANYVTSQKEGFGRVSQDFAEILFTGDISEGIGAGSFALAVGATWRQQSFWQYGAPVELMAYGPPRNAPQIGIRGFPPGFTGGSANLHEFSTVPVISGGYDVWEAFGELNLPLFESDDGNRAFEVDVAARYSEYSTSGGINSNKIGVVWQIVEPIRFRATQSRDVREPTFAERFNLQGGGGTVNDPVLGGASFPITTASGGNPNLKPEEADTVTAGFVITPGKAPGFQFSVDWFDIDLSDAVGSLGAQRIVNGCFAGDQSLCALISRDPVTQVIGTVRNVFLNIDSARVRGIDYELHWGMEPNLFKNQTENLTVRVLAGHQLEDSTTLSSGVTNENQNEFSQPALTGLASLRYQIGSYGFNLQQRYIGPSRLNNDWLEGVDIDDNTVASQMTTDLTLFYQHEMPNGSEWQASLAITNLLDEDPPVIASFGQRFSSQTVSNNFDTYGRRYMFNFRYGF